MRPSSSTPPSGSSLRCWIPQFVAASLVTVVELLWRYQRTGCRSSWNIIADYFCLWNSFINPCLKTTWSKSLTCLQSFLMCCQLWSSPDACKVDGSVCRHPLCPICCLLFHHPTLVQESQVFSSSPCSQGHDHIFWSAGWLSFEFSRKLVVAASDL